MLFCVSVLGFFEIGRYNYYWFNLFSIRTEVCILECLDFQYFWIFEAKFKKVIPYMIKDFCLVGFAEGT